MSRRRHISEDDSSLELLLDTMCNTFGGVMFIAITLFVLLSNSVFKTMNEESPDKPQEDIEALRDELNSLQQILAARKLHLQQTREQLQIQQESPIRRLQKELVLLRKLLQQSQLALQQHQLDKKTLQLEIDRLEKNLTDINSQQQKRTVEQQQKQMQLSQLQQQLQQLKTTPIQQLTMHFKVLQESPLAPFFIIMDQDRIYPVGPWKTPGQPDRPDEAVTTQKSQNGDTIVISCQIKPDHGINVLDGNALSTEFINFLHRIPADRVPKFYIPPASAPTAYRMRELLKASNITHGCTLADSDRDNFKYIYTDNVTYEY